MSIEQLAALVRVIADLRLELEHARARLQQLETSDGG